MSGPVLPPRLRLYELLRQGHRLTQAEFASRLGVTKRHVRRLVRTLREEEGVPVQQTRQGRGERAYYLDGPDLAPEGPFAMLSERQTLALLVAAEAARPTLRPTPLAGPLEAVGRRLAERLAPHVTSFDPEVQPQRWHFDSAAASTFDPEVFEILQKAIEEQRSVRMAYVTASTGERHPRRRVDPLLLAAAGSSWLVVAYCHKRGGVRDFALAGIERVWPCDPAAEEAGSVYFSPPADFDPELHFKGRFSAMTGEETHVIRLRAAPEAAPYFRRKRYHPTQQIEREAPDGALVISFETDGLDEVGAFVRSWGPRVEVLAPAALARQVAADARRVAEAYDPPPADGDD